MAFAHLHVHTEYSSLDGMIRVGDLFHVASMAGQTAAAVTDHGTLAGIWAAQKQADAAGVKLIPGQEFYLANGSRFDKVPFWVAADDTSADEDTERGDEGDGTTKLVSDATTGRKARAYQHLTVLAYSAEGWRNLVILNNEAYRSVWHKPRIDYALLKKHSAGLIVLTGCLGGPVIGPLAQAGRARAAAAAIGDTDVPAAELHLAAADEHARDASANVEALIDAVGAENVYVEIMDHGIPEESAVIPDVVALARTHGLAIVATNDAHHTHETDRDAQAAWLLVQSKSTIDKPKFTFHGTGYWLKTEAEMRAVRPEDWWQEACDTSQVIADRVGDRVLPGKQDLLPRFETPEGFAGNRDYIYHLLRDGARRIYGGITPEVRDRVRTEMEVIEESGYIDYFLVVHDLISWCLRNGIMVGPGRGSAGGSMVAYLLGITRIDPMRYGLLFERFLERGRQEPPDIDIDFPQSRRGEVIDYLRERWGEDRVSNIGTFQLARTKAAIKDAARVLGLKSVGDKMTALVPSKDAKPLPVGELLDPENASAAEYRKLVNRNDDTGHAAQRIHDLAAMFEDVVKGVGLHASGIIVSAMPLFDLVPMRKTKSGAWTLQWTGPEAEEVGLLKVDVLGLRNLDIAVKAVEYIAATTGETLDLLNLPDPDEPAPADAARVQAAWRTISEGRTEGLFQLESPKMTELAQDVAPHSLNDLSALVALFRPGPMGKGLHTEYAARKRDRSLVSYRDYTTHPDEQAALAGVLDETHGLLVYQEQVMMIGTVVAGFDAAGRSTLRKAVSKKKKDVMDAVGARFRAGAAHEHHGTDGELISRTFSETTVNVLWDAMVSFAEYAFNRSHSATYGYLAYITAFLKGNWPTEYAAATLAVTDDKDKRLQVLRSLSREGITVLAPDINAGNAYTAPAGPGQIRIGLAEVKSVSEAGERIAQVREQLGPFERISDLYERVQKPAAEDGTGAGSAITTGHVTALIEAGALDAWCGGNRLGLAAVAGAAKTVDIRPLPMEWSTLERASRQRDVLGVTIGEHPLVTLRDQVRAYQPFENTQGWDSRHSVTIVPVGRIPERDKETVTTIGVLAGWSERAYSRGRMANILIEGSSASISGTLFDRELGEHTSNGLVPNVGDVVAVTGRIRFRAIPTDFNDPDAEEQIVKELTVTRVRVVPIRQAVADEWPRDDAVVVPMLAKDAFDYEADVLAGMEAPVDAGDTTVPSDGPEDDGPGGGAPDQDESAPEEPAPAEQDAYEPPLVNDPPVVEERPAAVEQARPERMAAVSSDVPVNVIPFSPRLRAAGVEAPEWDVMAVLGVPSEWAGIAVADQRPIRLQMSLEDQTAMDPDALDRLVRLAVKCNPNDARVRTVKAVHQGGLVIYLTIGAQQLQVVRGDLVTA